MTHARKIKKKVVVFDFDGTIVNSMEAFARIASGVMPKHLPVDAETARRLYLETSGIPFFQQLEILFPNNSANAAVAEEFEKTKLESYLDEPLFDDATDTLKALRKNGMKVVVSSNNFQHMVDKYVAETKIEFDMVLGFKDGFAKGADHFNHIERALDVTKEDIVFVGDSLKDGERASSSGIGFIGKEGIFSREQFLDKFPGIIVISKLGELKEIFG